MLIFVLSVRARIRRTFQAPDYTIVRKSIFSRTQVRTIQKNDRTRK